MSSDDPTTEAPHRQQPVDPAPVDRYEIRVRGHLATRWTTWFDGLTLTTEDDGTTVISGQLADQAALHGLIQKLRDLGIPLLSLTRTAPDDAIEHPVFPHNPNRPNSDRPNPDRPNPSGAPS